jgi:hypothetical protein
MFILGFSHIAWVIIQVTIGGGKKNFVWGPIKKTSDDLKEFLFSSPVPSLLDLQQPFEIKTYS